MKGFQFSPDAIFYMARDMLLGLNNHNHHGERAIEMFNSVHSSVSEHLREEAAWFVNSFKIAKTEMGYTAPADTGNPMVSCVLALHTCATHGYMVFDSEDVAKVLAAAKYGYPLAMALVADNFQHCFYGYWMEYTIATSKFTDPMSLYNHGEWEKARRLGSYKGALKMAKMDDSFENVFFVLVILMEYIYLGLFYKYMYPDVAAILDRLFNSQLSAHDMYIVGDFLNRWNRVYNTLKSCYKIDSIVYYYHQCNRLTLEAIDAWLMIGRRLKICKDVRKLIATQIWELRYEWK